MSNNGAKKKKGDEKSHKRKLMEAQEIQLTFVKSIPEEVSRQSILLALKALAGMYNCCITDNRAASDHAVKLVSTLQTGSTIKPAIKRELEAKVKENSKAKASWKDQNEYKAWVARHDASVTILKALKNDKDKIKEYKEAQEKHKALVAEGKSLRDRLRNAKANSKEKDSVSN